MKPAELEAELASGRIRPAYLVVGEEPLLRDEALEALRQAVLVPGSEDFNFDRLEGESVRPAALFDALGMLPVMADRRLVILREPEAARGGGKALTEALAEAVPALVGGAETVLVVAAAKVDRRSRWFKAFRDPAAEVRCDPPKPGRETLAFVREEAKRQGVLFGKGAAELLAERVGPQLLLLRREIEKASLLTEPGGKVTRDQVAAGTCDVADEPIWDLTDAIGEGRSADALVVLAKVLGAGAVPPQLLAALATHFRKLLRMRTGGSAPGPPFVVKKLERQAGRYAPRRLRFCLNAIHETDIALKGAGALSADIALERLVIGLSS
jgi:DNA polymerase-3 subunit delta